MEKKLSRPQMILRPLVFLLLFAVLFCAVSRVLRNKNYAEAVQSFYHEPKGSVDVLLMGSSHMLNAVDPVQLRTDYGIRANNLAQNGQVLPVTWYALQDALTRQDPQVVVLDIYKVVQDSRIDSSVSLHFTLDNMPLSRARLEAVWDLLPAGERAEYVVDLIASHGRWKELTAQDFAPLDLRAKGAQVLDTHAVPYDGWQVAPEDVTAPPARVEIDYLDRIVALCRDRGIELLLVAVPFTTPEDDDLDRQAVVNGMAAYAEAHGLPFVNLMHRTEEMGFSFQEDMADVYHVNRAGMAKVTAWLGAYLRAQYDLPDAGAE